VFAHEMIGEHSSPLH